MKDLGFSSKKKDGERKWRRKRILERGRAERERSKFMFHGI